MSAPVARPRRGRYAPRFQRGKAIMGSYSASAQHLVDEMRVAALAEPARGLAFQGAPGANSDLAAREYDPNSLPLPCYAFQDAIDAVRFMGELGWRLGSAWPPGSVQGAEQRAGE